MVKEGSQTRLGKAFEYACIKALYDKYDDLQDVVLEITPQLHTAQHCFEVSVAKQSNLMEAAQAAIRTIEALEPRLQYPDGDSPLVLSLQSDAAGVAGDVRDVMCIRRGSSWQFGLSCKHNHHAVKHSRLSDSIDFGSEWFNHPCSQIYFSEVTPKFQELREMRDSGKETGTPAKWANLPDKAGDYYRPILQSFMDELSRLNKSHSDVPETLIRYLIGRHDFYKVITDDPRRVTRVEAINIAGTLNKASKEQKPITRVPVLKLPKRFYHIGFKETNGKESNNTIHVVCDEGWEISMRLHNASSRIEPSLKFDVQLISFPSKLFAQTIAWK